MNPEKFSTNVSLHHDGDGQSVLRFEHRYAHSRERVWRAITDGAEHSAWFGFKVDIDPVAGGKFTITFSEDFVEAGKVLEANPPELFVYTGRSDTFRWELSEDGAGCGVVLINTTGDPGHIPNSAAGFHVALDALERHLNADEQPDDAAVPFDELAGYYAEVLA